MGLVVKINAHDKPARIRKVLEELRLIRANKKQKKAFADYYGSLPDTYGDGLAYQLKQRDEWQ